MVEKIVMQLVTQMEERKIIEKSSRDYYEYVLITLAEHIIAVGTMLIIGMLFNQFIATIIFLVFFLSLRKRTGGYHADKFWQCYLATIITYIGIIQVAAILSEKSYIMCVTLFFAVLIIEIIGTVNHPNNDMDGGSSNNFIGHLGDEPALCKLYVNRYHIVFASDVRSKIIETGGKGKMKKTEKITNKVLKVVERIARNEVEKTVLGRTAECSAIYHQPKRPKKREN